MEAVFFDMDGLLLDTENLGMGISIEVGQENGIAITREDYLNTVGMNKADGGLVMAHLFNENYTYWDMCDQRKRRMHEAIEAEGLPVKKGAADLIKYLKGQKIRVGLVTSTGREAAEALLKIAGLYAYFDQLTTGDQVEKSKPSPEIYLLSAEKMGVNPMNTWALEDSYNGLKAAKGAGMSTIMVPDLKPYNEEIAPFVDRCFTSLEEAIPFFEGQIAYR